MAEVKSGTRRMSALVYAIAKTQAAGAPDSSVIRPRMPVAVGPRGPVRENIRSRISSSSRSTVVKAPAATVAGLPGWSRWRSPGTRGPASLPEARLRATSQ